MSRKEPHPVTAVQDVQETVDFISKAALEGMYSHWPRNQECPRSSFAVPSKDDLVLAVSHCWVYAAHPDPGCLKREPLRDLLEEAERAHKPQNQTLVFIDFLSVSQRPVRAGEPDRTPEQEAAFAKALRAFPQIYLQADAVLHVDVDPHPVPGDQSAYSVPLSNLEGVKLMQRGSALHVVYVPEDLDTAVHMFDIVDCVGGVRVRTIAEFETAKQQLQEKRAKEKARSSSWFSSWACASSSCCAEAVEVRMKWCPYGTFSSLTAGQKGWVYLERFASMVKGAMVPEDQIDAVAFASSVEAKQEIIEGACRLREAAQQGREHLDKALQYFVERLEEKHFTAVSLDKATNTGGVGGVTSEDKDVTKTLRDADIVGRLMRELVDDLAANWEKEQTRQRQRQLILAVNRGDVKAATQFLECGADLNAADGQGVTCMHLAAKCRDLDMVKLLINHKGDLTKKDAQGNVPAHCFALYADALTVDLFKVLAPTEKVMSSPNRAGVSVFERFEVWSCTAVSNKPYELADELVKQLLRDHAELSAMFLSGESPGSMVQEVPVECSDVDVKMGTRTIKVPVFHSATPRPSDRLVVWVGMALYMPRSLQEKAVRRIAGVLNAVVGTKVFFITEDIFGEEDFRDGIVELDRRIEGIRHVIGGLQLKGKYTFVDNALGSSMPVLWEQQAQLYHAVILNPLAWFSDEFVTSAGYRGMMSKVGEHAALYKSREIEQCLDVFGSFMFAKREADIAHARTFYRDALEKASPSFFALSGGMSCVVSGATGMFKQLGKMTTNVPITLVCGSCSPALLVQDTVARLQEIVPSASVLYIPKSKQWWECEGERQLNEVLLSLADLLQPPEG